MQSFVSTARVPRSVYFALFTVSGFAGLIYESIWSHYLKLFLGHAAYAQTLVLALFMGGMAIGSWLCSRYSDRWRNLLAGYAVAEGLIGVAAIAFHPVFVAVTETAFDSLLPALGDATLAALAKWSLGALLILPQSVLLGMTFPLMSAGLIRRYPSAPGGSLAMLYFTNSFGASIGVLASAFIMIDRLGLPGTITAAGLINLALAAIVWLLARRPEERPRRASSGRDAMRSSGRESAWMLYLVVAALTGAASFIYEIGWIRMLSLVLGSSTHSFELMLSAFILGLAFGGLWVHRRIDTIADPQRFVGIVHVLKGLLALATLPLYGQMFSVMQAVIKALAKTDAGYAFFLASSHGIAIAIMFPATFCAGMTLPLITYALLRAGHGEKSIGAVYAANTFGSIAGVFAAAHLGLPLLGLKGLISAGAALDVALGLALIWMLAEGRRLKILAGVFAAACFVLVLSGIELDAYKMASGVFRRGDLYGPDDATMVSYRDGKTTSVSLVDFPEGRSLRTNGKSDGAINLNPDGERISDEVTMVLSAALPLAHKPDAKNVAVIGIGTGLTTHTMLAATSVDSVDTIEIEPAMAEASRRFAPRNSNAFADPRSHIVFDDAKTFFSTHNRQYDIIISEPSNPWVSGVSSLFTREFYRHARRYLKPGGVLAQWFQLYEIDLSLVASVLQALGEVFPDYVIYATTNSDLLIVAGEPQTLSRPLQDVTKWAGVGRELRLVHVQTVGDLEIRRIGGKKALAPFFASYQVPANSDFHPYLDLHAAKYRFIQQYAGELTAIGTAGVPAISMMEGKSAATSVDPSLEGGEFLEKIELLRRARYARDFFLDDAAPDPLAIPRQFQKDLEITRMRLVDCRDPERFDIWFHSLYSLAQSVNPMLSAREGKTLWNRIGSPSCRISLSEAQNLWIELYRAVAGRDGATMALLAQKLLLLPSDLPTGNRQYLVAAAMTGHLARGERDRAAAVWNANPKEVDGTTDLTLRLLYAHAFDKR